MITHAPQAPTPPHHFRSPTTLRQPNKKRDDHKNRVAKAINDLKEDLESKIKHVAVHYGPTRDTLHNRYYGKTQAARAVHPEQRSPTEEQERSLEQWVEKQDALGSPPKHKELRRMVYKYSTTRVLRAIAAKELGITTPAASRMPPLIAITAARARSCTGPQRELKDLL